MGERFVQVAFNLPIPGSFTYTVPDGVECPLGARVIASFGKRSIAGFVVATDGEPPAGVPTIKAVTRVVASEPLFDAGYLELAEWMAKMYFSSLGESLAAMIPGGRRETEAPSLPTDESGFGPRDLTLSAEQVRALDTICGQQSGRFYVHGITGSGKTEVFLRTAARTLEEGRSVIYLVPEISLTHQLVRTIRDRFDESAAVIHSRLTPSQRLKEWMRIRRGEARFVIGARSAVFAPVTDLGLVVLDEEHEGSYKSGSSPRYHARQVALKRCSDAGARLVMGSATPSVEAWYLMREGVLTRLTLSERLSGGAMPVVRIVDLKGQRRSISTPLFKRIVEVHKEGRQSILFLNRRGFGHFFHCRSCGFQMTCRRCSVSMTFHKGRGRMLCHYCGYQTQPVETCPECGSVDVGFGGFGTEQVEEELAARLPGLRIERVDTDSIRRKGALESVIQRFHDGEIDILLGTQMVAKGLNFPGVKLVGILLADAGLHVPDFRAAERVFSLIVQVSGRAGRFVPDGEVVVQTLRPTHDTIERAASADIDGFYQGEIDVRRQLEFPPFSRLFRLVFRSKYRERAEQAAAGFRAALPAELTSVARVLGPSECLLSVIAGNHRRHLILQTKEFDRVHHLLSRVLHRFEAPRGVHIEVDVDPASVL